MDNRPPCAGLQRQAQRSLQYSPPWQRASLSRRRPLSWSATHSRRRRGAASNPAPGSPKALSKTCTAPVMLTHALGASLHLAHAVSSRASSRQHLSFEQGRTLSLVASCGAMGEARETDAARTCPRAHAPPSQATRTCCPVLPSLGCLTWRTLYLSAFPPHTTLLGHPRSTHR
ncbi:hypothetical protein DMC30DRAFT_86168 [Rhodotorula diobovata]|uniref:Uncharacterized protein n=1 Tax=Rhodotorula diobovata TaxID=5288 RepID=A0A5C5G3F3_9BASI|nr:hypothetical protein DMC30DRAFT_86168 [Rhodotorula diobovata]